MPQGVVWILDDALVYSVCVRVTRTSLGLFDDDDLHSTVSRDTNSWMLKTHFAMQEEEEEEEEEDELCTWCNVHDPITGDVRVFAYAKKKERTNEPIAMR